MSEAKRYVNPARVWTAMAMRKMTRKELAEKVGEKPATVGKWVKRSNYRLELTEEQLERLSLATHFPFPFFLMGDEEEEFDNLNMVGRQLFGSEYREM